MLVYREISPLDKLEPKECNAAYWYMGTVIGALALCLVGYIC